MGLTLNRHPDLEDPGWSYADQATAATEGWDVFDTGHGAGARHGYHDRFELQRIDFPFDENGGEIDCRFTDPTKGEGGACEHVLYRAFGGSPLHCKALAFIAKHSPREILRILGVLDDAHLYP